MPGPPGPVRRRTGPVRRRSSMKAVVYDAPGSFAIRDIPTPDPEPGEVRVRVRQTGICGTDLHIHNGKFFAEFPLTPGHELVGPVDALGAGTEGFGAGPTGLLLAQLIARGGAASVTVAASSAFKLKRAEDLGLDATFLMDRADLAGDAAKLKAASGGGFDIVVDATGAAAVSEQCVPLTRSGGTVMFYGVTEPEDLVRVSPYDVFRREITIKGSFAEIDSFPAAIAALRTGRARPAGLITHRFPLDDYADALDALRGDRTVHKIIIECWQK